MSTVEIIIIGVLLVVSVSMLIKDNLKKNKKKISIPGMMEEKTKK